MSDNESDMLYDHHCRTNQSKGVGTTENLARLLTPVMLIYQRPGNTKHCNVERERVNSEAKKHPQYAETSKETSAVR